MTDDPDPSSNPESHAGPSHHRQPLQNPRFRHISRSAAKRESVQLLGSIKDLQLHFSRSATIEHKAGVGVGVRGLGMVGEEGEENTPPLATSRGSKERRPWKEVELPRIDPEVARTELREVLGRVKEIWGIGSGKGALKRSPTTSSLSPGCDTRTVLITTAQAVRRTRELSLALISQPGRRVSGSSLSVPRLSKGRASISTPSRPNMPRAVSIGMPERKSSLGVVSESVGGDQLADLRKAALEVLGGLRGLEDRLRIDGSMSLSNSTLRIPSDSSSRPDTPLSSLTSEPESLEEEAYNLNILAADVDLHQHLQTWEERVIAEGREYRVMAGGEGIKERDSVKRWVGEVEGLFLDQDERSIAGRWAEGGWEGREMERVHDFITCHVPFNVEMLVPSTKQEGFHKAFLNRLSDGFILVLALNNALHQSPKSWGFVPSEDIHDTLADTADTIDDEGKSKVGSGDWTFRRVGNLTSWAAALRHRYQIPIHLPAQSSTSTFLTTAPLPTTRSRLIPEGRPIIQPLPPGPAQVAASRRREKDTESEWTFDPLLVARRGEGWEGMLMGLMVEWVERAAGEVRGSEVRSEEVGVRREERGGRV